MWPVVLLLLTDSSLATGQASPDDTNTVEHNVTKASARLALELYNPTDLVAEGCRPCTDRQIGYCLSDDLVTDHCLCDHRHYERLPYMEHTCYVPDRYHPTFATDCHEYVRLLECCCHAALLPKLRQMASNGSTSTSSRLASLLLPVVIALRLTSALGLSTSSSPPAS